MRNFQYFPIVVKFRISFSLVSELPNLFFSTCGWFLSVLIHVSTFPILTTSSCFLCSWGVHPIVYACSNRVWYNSVVLKKKSLRYFTIFSCQNIWKKKFQNSWLVKTVMTCRILEWMTKRTRHYPDVNIRDFTSSLADGRVFLAILDDYDPEECPYTPSDSPAKNLTRWAPQVGQEVTNRNLRQEKSQLPTFLTSPPPPLDQELGFSSLVHFFFYPVHVKIRIALMRFSLFLRGGVSMVLFVLVYVHLWGWLRQP